MAQIFNNNSCKLKSQNFYKSEPNLVFNCDNKYKPISNNNKENYTDVLDYKSYINQQRELLEQIYHQQKKLKQFHFETDYSTNKNTITTTDSNNNTFSSCSSPKIISPQSRTNLSNKNNIYSNNSNIIDTQNEVLLNKQNIMSISFNNNNNKHIHKSKTFKKPVSSLSPSNETLSSNLQFQNKFVLNKCKVNDSVNMNSCCKTKINSQFVLFVYLFNSHYSVFKTNIFLNLFIVGGLFLYFNITREYNSFLFSIKKK